MHRALLKPSALYRARHFVISSGQTRYLCHRFTTDSKLTHIDGDGRATMVDVGSKKMTQRTAVAAAQVDVGDAVFSLLQQNISPGGKGNVFGVAQLAGIMAAKRTPELIPLCHTVRLSRVDVKLSLCDASCSVRILATASTPPAQTGVEMEALTAASVAALTVYDMCKAVSKTMHIRDVHLVSKTGGKSDAFPPRAAEVHDDLKSREPV